MKFKIILILLLLLSNISWAAPPTKPGISGQWGLVGGNTGDLDNLSILKYIDHSIIFVVYDSGAEKTLYFYQFDEGVTAIEDGEEVIRADNGHGTHTGSNSATLTDSTQGWAAGSLIDYRIYNVTDGSNCLIVNNTDTTITCTLSSGSWDNGEDYVIQGVWKSISSIYTRPTTQPSATAYDADVASGDRSYIQQVNCIDTTPGEEDCEVTEKAQINGVPDVLYFHLDCDTSGNCHVNFVPQGTGRLQINGSQINFTDIAGTAIPSQVPAIPTFESLAVADLDDPTTPSVLTTDETINKAISNYKATGADHVFSMPVAHDAGNVIFPIGDAFQVDIEPASGTNFYLNGEAMANDEHIQNTADTIGQRIVGYCVNIEGTLTWMFYSADADFVEETP